MPASLPFHIMTKPIGPICNLDCRYCFYLEKESLYPGTKHWAMPAEVLESYIRQYIAAQPEASVHFAWQGGEPTLLGIEFFENVVRLQQQHASDKQITNTIQTNGVLLDDSWAEFLARHDFLVGISIDGPRELHDHYRVDKGGQPTFGKVMSGMRTLKKHGVQFNTLTVVNRENSHRPLDVYRFLREHGSGYMQFIPVVERIAPEASEVTPWSVEPLAFGRFLCSIFDEWVRRDVGRQFVQHFDVALEIWCGMAASLCVFRETCGLALALEHQGDLFSCDHFVYPENKLGNIINEPLEQLVAGDQQRRFGRDKRDQLPRYCRECDVRFACNGECPKHRFARTPDGEPGLNYLCAGYKMFFRHIDPHMKWMARELKAGRAPANIMKRLAQQDLGVSSKPGRNDSCPCGSGRKFKHCCADR